MTVARVLLLSPIVLAARPDTDLASVVASLLDALRERPRSVVLHEPVWNVEDIERAVGAHRPDVVFNACETLEGKAESEPIVARVLERLEVAFTGNSSGCLGRCLRKEAASEVLRAAGVRVPETYPADAVPTSAYPVIVKPECEDGSIGIDADSVVHDERGLRRAVRALDEAGRPALVQRYIDGREVSVTLLGWPNPRVLPPGEIRYDAEAFDGRARILTYASKWDATSIDHRATQSVAATLSRELFDVLSRDALGAALALGMRDYGRIDFRIDASNRPFVIDANPNCDLSADGGFMLAGQRAGLDYADVIDVIVSGAIARSRVATLGAGGG